LNSVALLEAQRTGVITRQFTSWAAILAVPTAIAGIYGMNFKSMPGLNTAYGYLVVLGLMAVSLPFPVRCASRRPSGYEYRMSRFSSSSPCW
jgi:Mg2+ and Co2+ transporter CorA